MRLRIQMRTHDEFPPTKTKKDRQIDGVSRGFLFDPLFYIIMYDDTLRLQLPQSSMEELATT